jgi:hypothetical protein
MRVDILLSTPRAERIATLLVFSNQSDMALKLCRSTYVDLVEGILKILATAVLGIYLAITLGYFSLVFPESSNNASSKEI